LLQVLQIAPFKALERVFLFPKSSHAEEINIFEKVQTNNQPLDCCLHIPIPNLNNYTKQLYIHLYSIFGGKRSAVTTAKYADASQAFRSFGPSDSLADSEPVLPLASTS